MSSFVMFENCDGLKNCLQNTENEHIFANILRNKYIKSPVGVVEKQYQLNYADVANQDT